MFSLQHLKTQLTTGLRHRDSAFFFARPEVPGDARHAERRGHRHGLQRHGGAVPRKQPVGGPPVPGVELLLLGGDKEGGVGGNGGGVRGEGGGVGPFKIKGFFMFFLAFQLVQWLGVHLTHQKLRLFHGVLHGSAPVI